MIFTTRVKIFLKKNTPSSVFSIVRYIADKTFLKLIPFIFSLRTASFKKKIFRHVSYKSLQFDIEIDPSNGFLDKTVFVYGAYEPHIIDAIMNNIKPGDVCLDIGANIGYHTIVMSKNIGDSGRVYAFEPIPKMRDHLTTSLKKNNLLNVTVIPEALSNKKDTLTLFLSSKNIAGSSFVNQDTTATSLLVPVVTLDSLSYEKVDFIKLDVEGFEYNVLQGGEKTITRELPTVIFEYSPLYYEKNNPKDKKDILAFFKEKNYRMYDLEDGNKEIKDIDAFVGEFREGLRSQTNILAKPVHGK